MNVKTSKIFFKLGYFRILHALPDLPNVDLYIDDKLVAQNLSYSNYTAYLPMFGESYKLSLYEAGTRETPLLTDMLSITEDDLLTLATVTAQNNVDFLAIPDTKMPTEQNKAMVRFVHLSPNAPPVDIALPDGTILFSNVTYMQGTPYMTVEPSNYTLQVRAAGTPDVVLTIPNINVDPNSSYSIYALGLVGEQPELEAILLLDGFK